MAGTRSARRARQERIACAARAQSGLLTTSQLRSLGVTGDTIRAEVDGRRWSVVRRRTIQVEPPTDGRASWWAAVLACSPQARTGERCTAALGGLTALLVAGLEGVTDDGLVHVAAPKSSRPLPAAAGTRIHETRRWRDEDVVLEPIPHIRAPMATVQAALWARSDREAALLLVTPVQQRLTTASAVRECVQTVRRDRRRALLRAVADELVDGVRSLNELDFAGLCGRRGLPEPDRQVVVPTTRGRAYLDVRWDRWRVTVEVDGFGHLRLDRWLEDSVRHNELAVTGDVVLRIPSLGLRLDPAEHLDLVERALRHAGWRPVTSTPDATSETSGVLTPEHSDAAH